MSYFQEQYDKLSPEQKRYIYDRDRQWQMARCYSNSIHRPEPEPVAPKAVVYNYADSQEVRATINHLEGKVNGTLKMAHTHSKKGNKYNTYSLEERNTIGTI